MAQIGFAERFAYLRWLRARGRLAPESDRELAEALGVGESWVRKWKSRADAPPGRTEALRISEELRPWGGKAAVDWLYDGSGTAPAPELWNAWLEGYSLVAERKAGRVRDIPVEAMERVTSKKPAPRKRANDR